MVGHEVTGLHTGCLSRESWLIVVEIGLIIILAGCVVETGGVFIILAESMDEIGGLIIILVAVWLKLVVCSLS